jgi:hypothetical protein
MLTSGTGWTRSAAGWLAGITAAIVLVVSPLSGQGGGKYNARLGWVPISGAERANVTGKGSATATLSGTKLSITGTFEGLAAPATVARLHRGVAIGARGPAIGDLTITKAAQGMISGAFDLSPDQVESLNEGRLYVQVHSEKGVAPDGSNLWGWLLR